MASKRTASERRVSGSASARAARVPYTREPSAGGPEAGGPNQAGPPRPRTGTNKGTPAVPKPPLAARAPSPKRTRGAGPGGLEAPRARVPGSARVVAVTGAFGSMGRRLLRKLESDPDIDRVIAVDIRPVERGDGEQRAVRDARQGRVDALGVSDPAAFLSEHTKLSVHALDLTETGADRALAEILLTERAGVLVHLAFLSSPTHALEMAHELETIGTMYTLHACAAAGVGHVVMLSSALCYGAHPDNPAWIVETQPLRPPESRSLRDKADADGQVQRFGIEHKDVVTAVARVGFTLGSASDHFFTKMLARPVVPAVLGYDPLWQLLWIDDSVDAIYALLKTRARGTFNVAGRGVLPLSHVLTHAGKVPLYVPARLGGALLGALWSAQLIEMPRSFLSFFRWGVVCDTDKLRAETGFQPARAIEDVLERLRVPAAVLREPARDTSAHRNAADAQGPP